VVGIFVVTKVRMSRLGWYSHGYNILLLTKSYKWFLSILMMLWCDVQEHQVWAFFKILDEISLFSTLGGLEMFQITYLRFTHCGVVFPLPRREVSSLFSFWGFHVDY
jgi:hypothetical protein